MTKYALHITLEHWNDEDEVTAMAILGAALRDSCTIYGYWKSFLPPNHWDFHIGRYSTEGVERAKKRYDDLFADNKHIKIKVREHYEPV